MQFTAPVLMPDVDTASKEDRDDYAAAGLTLAAKIAGVMARGQSRVSIDIDVDSIPVRYLRAVRALHRAQRYRRG